MTDINTKAAILGQIDTHWNLLQQYLGQLTDVQRAQRTDAAGWTVKDHVMHLAAWQDSLPALLDGMSRPHVLGVPIELWDAAWSGSDETGWDAVNAVIQRRYRDRSWDDVMTAFAESRQRVLDRLTAMADDDLMLPYRHYQPDSTIEVPVAHWFRIATYEHYEEHLPWIKAIAEGK
ncbi:MAG: ClbS/DfsB family four-helix bundle protein [Chloroflexi bacterium]|nr:ClbS/DfsB family four-helix bundle protein [Chloroflexota bacterium]